MNREDKIGIVFGSGGARGAYQVGVLKALKETGILEKVDAVSGASVGSLNASLFVMGNLEFAEKIWFEMDNDTLFQNEEGFLNTIFKNGLNIMKEGYYKTEKFKDLLNKHLDYETIKRKNVFVSSTHVSSKKPSNFDLLTFNIRGEFNKKRVIKYTNLKELENEEILSTLMASCAIPLFFEPVTFNGETYYDGGIFAPTPSAPLIEHGCNKIIIIDLFKLRLRTNKCPKDVQMEKIKPSKSLKGVLDFSNELITNRFKIGFEDGKKFINENPELFS